MANDLNLGSAGQAGSPNNGPDSGQPTIEQLQEEVSRILDEKEHLERKLGEQGRELGEVKGFINNISPVLDKLDEDPALVQAILDGSISYGQAVIIKEAHEKVEKKMGKEEYTQTSAEDIQKLVASEVSKAEQKMDAKMAEAEELRSFEASVNEFIARTPDFPEYAKDIDRWMDDHREVLDVSVAYYAVKGLQSVAEAQKISRQETADYAKQMAGAAGGGSSRSSFAPIVDSNLIDDLVSGRSNPNVL
jgi:hypothetical protein